MFSPRGLPPHHHHALSFLQLICYLQVQPVFSVVRLSCYSSFTFFWHTSQWHILIMLPLQPHCVLRMWPPCVHITLCPHWPHPPGYPSLSYYFFQYLFIYKIFPQLHDLDCRWLKWPLFAFLAVLSVLWLSSCFHHGRTRWACPGLTSGSLCCCLGDLTWWIHWLVHFHSTFLISANYYVQSLCTHCHWLGSTWCLLLDWVWRCCQFDCGQVHGLQNRIPVVLISDL